jgi:hypothetical protein
MEAEATLESRHMDVYHCPRKKCRAQNALCSGCAAKQTSCVMPSCRGRLVTSTRVAAGAEDDAVPADTGSKKEEE